MLVAPGVFATQGTVVSTSRTYRGRRLGPYFRLAFRKGGRQWSIYLGRSEGLARRVRDLLARLQHPRRWRRASRRLQAQVRASLRKAKAQLRKELAVRGITLKGWEFRGVRRAFAAGLGGGQSHFPYGKIGTVPGSVPNAWQTQGATVERGSS
ncbi:MAG: hypothetical protein ABIP48_19950 [Planctomycetota bacterium]